MLDSLNKKTKYGELISLTKFIQIPILQYTPGLNINENPYIRFEDIKTEYELVKGKAVEIDFWEKIKFMFEQGKLKGYEDNQVFPINEKQAVIEVDKSIATFNFWDPDVALDDEEEEWLLENADQHKVYIEGNPTSFYIYIKNMDKIKGN